MEFDHENVRLAIEEDRMSSLPDELIHHILSFMDTKYAVQTCLLSSRWKFLWKSMSCLNFSSYRFKTLAKFGKFVNRVLSNRNHQIEVTSVKLEFNGASSQFFVRKIANYVFSHNVQELTVVNTLPKDRHEFPLCLFSSQSLKRFSLKSWYHATRIVPKTPWDFPSLTSLHLNEITLYDGNPHKSIDLFSKCVNLNDLTLDNFLVNSVEVFDIISPRLSKLTLIDGRNLETLNLVAPQLENLTVIDCSIRKMIAPPGLSTLFYKGYLIPQLSKDGFDSLEKATIFITSYHPKEYAEKDARMTIGILQELHSVRFLTLDINIVECLSSFPDLISHLPSPFSNLICLNIDHSNSRRKDPYNVKMSIEARNFFLENSPSAKFIMELPEPPPTKAMKQKEARAKKKAKLAADIESYINQFQASLELGKNIFTKMKQVNIASQNHMAELEVLTKQQSMQNESPIEQSSETQMQVDQNTELMNPEKFKEERSRVWGQILVCLSQMKDLNNQTIPIVESILPQKYEIGLLLKSLSNRQKAEIESRYSSLFPDSKPLFLALISKDVSLKTFMDDIKKYVFDTFSPLDDMHRNILQKLE